MMDFKMTDPTKTNDAPLTDTALEKQSGNDANDTGLDASDDGSVKRAVALHYDHKDAPKVVAKGEGHVAEQIITAAAAHGVYIKENPLLAQALGAVELDEEIPVELYTAVAEIIGFVLSLKDTPRTSMAQQAD